MIFIAFHWLKSTCRPNQRQRTLTPPATFKLPAISSEDEETSSYHELQRRGGRPVRPLEDFQKALRIPQPHVEVLKPWLHVLEIGDIRSEDVKPFTTQLESWKEFEQWQLETRGVAIHAQDTSLTDFSQFLEEKRRVFLAMGETRIAEGPNFEATIKVQWQQRQNIQIPEPTQRRVMRHEHQTRETMAKAKQRLKRAGFTSERSFRFLKNPKTQDARTTWIEYLRFECWRQDELLHQTEQEHQELELQERRMQWIIAQIHEIEADTEAPRDSTRIAKRKREADEDEAGDDHTDQLNIPTTKRRVIRGKTSRIQHTDVDIKPRLDANRLAKRKRKADQEEVGGIDTDQVNSATKKRQTIHNKEISRLQAQRTAPAALSPTWKGRLRSRTGSEKQVSLKW